MHSDRMTYVTVPVAVTCFEAVLWEALFAKHTENSINGHQTFPDLCQDRKTVQSSHGKGSGRPPNKHFIS